MIYCVKMRGGLASETTRHNSPSCGGYRLVPSAPPIRREGQTDAREPPGDPRVDRAATSGRSRRWSSTRCDQSPPRQPPLRGRTLPTGRRRLGANVRSARELAQGQPHDSVAKADHYPLRRNDINVIVVGKQPEWHWLGIDSAVRHCTSGAGIWHWACTWAGDPRCGDGLRRRCADP